MNLAVECARARPERGRVRAAAGAVTDWEAALEQAERHGVSALVYWSVSEYAEGLVPAEVLRRLRARFHENAAWNLRLTAELHRVLSRLAQAGVVAVPFKGPAAAWTLYESPALRAMSDLDVLVRPGDAARAVEMLAADGYECPYPRDLRFYRMGHELPMVSVAAGVAVDLHWALAPSHLCHGLDMDGVWRRLATVEVAGRTMAALGDQDLTIFLCVHGAKHGWCSLHWLADLARLIERCDTDWAGLMEQVRERRVSRMVFAGLLLAVDALGAAVPAQAVREMRADAGAAAIATAWRQRLVDGEDGPATMRENMRLQLRLLERAPDRMRFLWSQVEPTPADHRSMALPGALFPLYYVYRPLRLLAKSGSQAVRKAG